MIVVGMDQRPIPDRSCSSLVTCQPLGCVVAWPWAASTLNASELSVVEIHVKVDDIAEHDAFEDRLLAHAAAGGGLVVIWLSPTRLDGGERCGLGHADGW